MIYMIGIMTNTNRDITTFRIYNVDTGESEDVPYDKLYYMMSEEKVKIENLRIRGKDIDINRHNLGRYGIVSIDGKDCEENTWSERLVVLYKYGGGIYKCINHSMHEYFVTKDFLIDCYKTDLANTEIDGKGNIRFVGGCNVPVRSTAVDDKERKIFNYYTKCSLLGISPISLRRREGNSDVELIRVEKDSVNVIVPNFVTRINKSVFNMYVGLEDITLPTNLKYIGNFNFVDCYNLKNIEIPDSVSYIGDCSFENCIELKSIKLPLSLDKIGIQSFRNCIKLECLELPEGIQSIGNKSFMYCRSIENIIIPESVQEIGDMAFYQCDNLKNVYIKNKNTRVSAEAFKFRDGSKPVISFGQP